MGPTATLAQFIADLRYEALPQALVDAAKVAIIDGVGNMVAGSAQPLAQTIGQYTQDMGGRPQCSVVGWGFKTNPPAAAFANGVFGHCLDFEIQGYPPTHGTSSCLPAALALAEANDMPGKAIITAYVLGWEIQGRLRAASGPHTAHAYHPPGLVGPLGGAAASASVLGLDAQQTNMALGIAASRTGGLTANTGTMVKSTHPGNAARMGAEAAILAHGGYTSSDEALESETGYAQALFGRQLDWDAVTAGLGTAYRLLDPGFEVLTPQSLLGNFLERERADRHSEPLLSSVSSRDSLTSSPPASSSLLSFRVRDWNVSLMADTELRDFLTFLTPTITPGSLVIASHSIFVAAQSQLWDSDGVGVHLTMS